MAGLQLLLKDDGIAVVEVPYVKEMIDQCEFDTIYHEHLCYFSLTALDQLFRRHRLVIADVEIMPIHGRSLRLSVCQESAKSIESDVATASRVSQLLAEEARWGVCRPEFYRSFAAKIESLRRQLVQMLADLKTSGKGIAAYGASAKGSTLLNYFGIGREMLDFVADRSTVKQGMYTPGMHLPICGPEKLLEAMPDYVLAANLEFCR